MSRKKIEEKIRKKEQDIQELEMQLREAKSYIQALQDVLKIMPREDGQDDTDVVIRPGSAVDEARQIILRNGAPMHVMDILKAMGREPTRESRASLSSSLAAYVRRGEVFTRSKPNTFGLAEFAASRGVAAADRPVLPPGFGRVPEHEEAIEDDV